MSWRTLPSLLGCPHECSLVEAWLVFPHLKLAKYQTALFPTCTLQIPFTYLLQSPFKFLHLDIFT